MPKAGTTGHGTPPTLLEDPDAPRAWVLNLDAEHELEVRGVYTSPGRLTRLLRPHVAAAAAELLRPEDVLLDESRAPTNEERRACAGRPGFAWCPTPRALRTLEAAGAVPVPTPAVEVLRAVNARPFARAVRATLALESGPPAFAKDLAADLDTALRLLGRPSRRGWLVRRPFGAAGRGRRRLYPGPLNANEQAWLEASLRHGALVIEPFVEVTREVTRSGLVLPDGSLRVAGPGVQTTTRTGAWADTEPVAASRIGRQDDVALEGACRAAGEALAAAGYRGPYGIDAFRYMDGVREVLNPLSEINARFTMDWARTLPVRSLGIEGAAGS